MISNAGADLVFCRWGAGGQTAVNTDVPVTTGTQRIFSKGSATVIACIANASTATVRIITGDGW